MIGPPKPRKIKPPSQANLNQCWDLMVMATEAKTLKEEADLIAEVKRLMWYRK